MFAFSAHRADPGPSGFNQLALQPQRNHADDFPGVKPVNARNRTGSGADGTGQTMVLIKGPVLEQVLIQAIHGNGFGCRHKMIQYQWESSEVRVSMCKGNPCLIIGVII
jgi:hypothetical protein